MSSTTNPDPEAIAGNVYLLNTYAFSLNDVLVEESALIEEESAKIHGTHRIVCSRSIFHPQGGGQPSDVGVLTNKDNHPVFAVNFSQKNINNGKCNLYGTYVDRVGELAVGDEVNMHVDEAKRVYHAKLHSAGHCIDAALSRAGLLDKLEPTKGYHFIDGPNVEYRIKGTAAGAEVDKAWLDSLPALLTEQFAAIAAESIPTVVFYEFPKQKDGKEDESKGGWGDGDGDGSDPRSSSSNSPSYNRIVEVAHFRCPCGGTHINNTAELGTVHVTKAKKKKDTVKISYEIL